MASRPVTVRMPTLERAIPASVRAAILRQAGLLLIGRIKRRTKAGLDVSGQPFKAYSTAYSDQRRRSGWDTSPDLWLTGAMLNAMQLVESTERRAVIGFVGAAPAVQFAKRSKARTNKKTGAKVTHTFRNSTSRTVANGIKAYAHDKGDGVPRRHFFGLSPEDKAFAARFALRELTKAAASRAPRR